MLDEMTALHSNGTWNQVFLTPSKTTADYQWVYIVETCPYGQIDCPKAQLIAEGYTLWARLW